MRIFLLACIIFLSALDMVLAIPMPPCNKEDICTAHFNQGNFYPDQTPDLKKFDLVMINLNPITNQGRENILDYLEDRQTVIFYEGYTEKLKQEHQINDWNFINTKENWFMHWRNGTRKTGLVEYPNIYVMNFSNQEYINYQINRYVNLFPVQEPFFEWDKIDGYFADDVGTHDGWVLYIWRVPPNSPSEVPLSENDFNQAHINFLQQLKPQLGNIVFFINGANTALNPYVDGSMLEGFALRGDPVYPFYSESYWKEQVDTLLDSSYNNKWSWASSRSGTEDADKRYFNFSFASYLLAKNPNAWAFFNFQEKYYPEYDINIGRPLGDYYKINALYVRDFENGKVLVNPTPQIFTYNLPQQYKTFDGTVVDSLQFNGQYGYVLLNTSQCGNGIIESGETCSSCPQDVSCGIGTCCNDACTVPLCTSNAQCNDNNASTSDSCINPGTCTASCTFTAIQANNTAVCGNGILENGETCITCAADFPPTQCISCGNGIIETGENCFICPTDVICGANEICSDGICTSNLTIVQTTCDLDCNDYNPCTQDSCSGSEGRYTCLYTRITGCSDDGNQKMDIILPPYVIKGELFDVKVVDERGEPIYSATVVYKAKRKLTDLSGIAQFIAIENTRTVYAEKAGYEGIIKELTIEMSYFEPLIGKIKEMFGEDPVFLSTFVALVLLIFTVLLKGKMSRKPHEV